MTQSSCTYLAIDLGASSGRVLAARFDGQRLDLEEVHRFDNGPVAAAGRLYWDALYLWTQILEGLRKANSRYDQIRGIGVDTWGVDFALLDRHDRLLGNPVHYRDSYTDGMMDQAVKTVSRSQIFAETGLQFMPINTLYQLLALHREESPLLASAASFLMMPDLFNFFLSGEKANEFTDASTTQFLNPTTRNWSRSLLEKFQLPTNILQPIIAPGTTLGSLRSSVQSETGLGSDVPVIAPGTHDTASAVMAVPSTGAVGDQPNWCYISSGTWSLMGVEVAAPVINDSCAHYNFTNEGGVGGTIRLLKNITGMWLMQECRRIWSRAGREFGWDQLITLAEQAAPLRSLINPDDPRFSAPDDMPSEICQFCRETEQPIPDSEGAVIRCTIESLALRYRMVLGWLEELTGGMIEVVHVVGGGSQNQLLCQMTATACGRIVVAGPVEATALGNVLMQAIARNDVGSMAEGRSVIAASQPFDRYEPGPLAPWDNAFERFLELFETDK